MKYNVGTGLLIALEYVENYVPKYLENMVKSVIEIDCGRACH